MLNRKASNYIFYLILLGIVAIVFLVRSIMLGGLVDKTTKLDNDNISLQAQIDSLKDIVQVNKDIQEGHLYELYNQVPETYSSTELTYLAISKLERVGISESSGFDRKITLNTNVSFSKESTLSEIESKFKVVEVVVTFYMVDMTVVSDLIDVLNESEQVFLINYVDFFSPEGENYVEVEIHFLSFFEK